MRNLDLEFDKYLENVKSVLIHKYNLSNQGAYGMLVEYEFLSSIYKDNPNHFFYYSPLYWADYIMENETK